MVYVYIAGFLAAALVLYWLAAWALKILVVGTIVASAYVFVKRKFGKKNSN